MRRTARPRRLLRILTVLARHALAELVGRLPVSPSWLRRRLPATDLPGPERLRTVLEEIGGTFIKFGQMLALQPDIVSRPYCDALFKLMDRIDPFPFSRAEQTLREELGGVAEELLETIDRAPLATASVGQVHLAWVEGKKVAVKVQRPTVETDFAGDVGLMRMAIRVIRLLRLRALYWLLEPLSEFVVWTDSELDFRHEARFMELVGRNARGNRVQKIPQVFERFTSRRTLVVEFLEGVALLDYLRARDRGDEVLLRRLSAGGFVPRRFAAHVIDNFLGDAFRHGAYHADLHPANLMILPDNVVGYVDFGITGLISSHGRRHLVAMTRALAAGDMETLTDHFMQVSAAGPGGDLDGFDRGLDRLARTWFRGEGAKRTLETHITRVMADMLHLSRRTNILPERDIIKYIRSSIAIDGLVTRFEPDFHIGRYLESTSSRYLEMAARHERFSPGRLLEWSHAGGELLEDGARRLADALERLGRQRPEAEARQARRRALQLPLQLAAVLLVTALVVATDRGSELGFNIWSGQLLLFAATGFALLRSLVRRPGAGVHHGQGVPDA